MNLKVTEKMNTYSLEYRDKSNQLLLKFMADVISGEDVSSELVYSQIFKLHANLIKQIKTENHLVGVLLQIDYFIKMFGIRLQLMKLRFTKLLLSLKREHYKSFIMFTLGLYAAAFVFIVITLLYILIGTIR